MTAPRMLVSVAEAEALIRAALPPCPTIWRPIEDAHGCVLREDLVAGRDLPAFDRVTMDGAAIAFAAWNVGQRRFMVEATSSAGVPRKALQHAAAGCIKVMTGAVLPEGCDCVIPLEEYTEDQGTVIVRDAYAPALMQYVHRQGADAAAGQPVLAAGIHLRGPQIALAVMLGRKELCVARPHAVALVSTGDELVAAGQPAQAHQIWPSNGYGMAATLRRHGFYITGLWLARDDLDETARVVQMALENADVVVLSGGVSAGAHDYVPEALERVEVTPVFHKIRQTPGKPMWFGVHPFGPVVFALPGNPVSSLMCLHRYVLPALLQTLGAAPAPAEYAQLTDPVEFSKPLTFFPPVQCVSTAAGLLQARPLPYHGSGHLAGLAASDGFAELPPCAPGYPAGAPVRIFRWS